MLSIGKNLKCIDFKNEKFISEFFICTHAIKKGGGV
jgi:hypothetical protein